MAACAGVRVRVAARARLRRRASRTGIAARSVPHGPVDVQSRRRRWSAHGDRGGNAGGVAVHEQRLVSPTCGDPSLTVDRDSRHVLDGHSLAEQSVARCQAEYWLPATGYSRGQELLNALTVRVSRVHGALRIDDDAVNP